VAQPTDSRLRAGTSTALALPDKTPSNLLRLAANKVIGAFELLDSDTPPNWLAIQSLPGVANLQRDYLKLREKYRPQDIDFNRLRNCEKALLKAAVADLYRQSRFHNREAELADIHGKVRNLFVHRAYSIEEFLKDLPNKPKAEQTRAFLERGARLHFKQQLTEAFASAVAEGLSSQNAMQMRSAFEVAALPSQHSVSTELIVAMVQKVFVNPDDIKTLFNPRAGTDDKLNALLRPISAPLAVEWLGILEEVGIDFSEEEGLVEAITPDAVRRTLELTIGSPR